jgi:CheY-like chemotaxis protein
MVQAMNPNGHSAISANPRILIADPDEDNRALYHEALRAAGYAVTEASDGRAALTEALMRPPALLLMELRLPLVDGYGLCEVLRRDPETRSIPILVVTAEARERELRGIREAGANAVLVKPAVPDVVLREVERWLSDARDARQLLPEATAETAATPWAPVSAGTGAGSRRRTASVKAHTRFATTKPPLPPPTLMCPSCDRALAYEESYVGGVSQRHAEQWDYYGCSACGTFQYRQRTRKLRRVDEAMRKTHVS